METVCIVLKTSLDLKKILSRNFWSLAMLKFGLLVTAWVDFSCTCQALLDLGDKHLSGVASSDIWELHCAPSYLSFV